MLKSWTQHDELYTIAEQVPNFWVLSYRREGEKVMGYVLCDEGETCHPIGEPHSPEALTAVRALIPEQYEQGKLL